MLAAFVVMWRESLEAALVVAILLAYLKRIGQTQNSRYIYAGVVAALIACLLFVKLSSKLQSLFEGAGEEIFQAGVMLVAVATVSGMVIWMHGQARSLRGSLEQRAALLIDKGQLLSLATLAGIAVFREGVETTLFMWGIVTSSANSAAQLFVASLAGVGAALATAYGIFRGAAQLNLRRFFQITSIALLLIAAGMLAQAANRLIGVGVLPPIVGQVWDSAWLLDERGLIGSLAATLFGYRSRPSLMELALYLLYFPPVLLGMHWAA